MGTTPASSKVFKHTMSCSFILTDITIRVKDLKLGQLLLQGADLCVEHLRVNFSVLILDFSICQIMNDYLKLRMSGLKFEHVVLTVFFAVFGLLDNAS